MYEFNLPTGFSCPFAGECLVKVNRETGKFNNLSKQYKCYAASAERFPGVREHRWKNFEYVKSGGVVKIPQKAKSIRIHASGVFFNQQYFDMWLKVCEKHPDVEFWAYTKSLKYWVNRLYKIPNNLVLTASKGGKNDYLIEKYNLKNVEIVKTYNNAVKIGRCVDVNDDLARIVGLNFALVDNFAK